MNKGQEAKSASFRLLIGTHARIVLFFILYTEAKAYIFCRCNRFFEASVLQ